MGKVKHIRPAVATRRNGRTINVLGGKSGPRSREVKDSLIHPQAETVVHKFGGARELARAIQAAFPDPKDHYNPSSIYRWMYPLSVGGTGGEIPAGALKKVIKAARYAGILLTPEDLFPQKFRDDSI
jgi:hypothetical protein